MNILLIETATSVCSVALVNETQLLQEIHSEESNSHSAKLNLFIRDVLSRSGVSVRRLDGVCVSSGPGSYTGLRIGISSAKGLCYACDVPLLSVPTLQNMAAWYYQQHPDYTGFVCPMIDARRMECYTAVFDRRLQQLKNTTAEIVTEGLYDVWLNSGPVTFIGDGAAKTREILSNHSNACYDDSYRISAEGMRLIAFAKLNNGEKEDVAYFEPFYLKDFVAKKSVVHGLRG